MDNNRLAMFQEIAEFITDLMPECVVTRFDDTGVYVDSDSHEKVGGFSIIWTDKFFTVLTWWNKGEAMSHQCPIDPDTFLRWAMLNNLVVTGTTKETVH